MKISPEFIKRRTNYAKSYFEELVKRVERYKEDNQKDRRIVSQECKKCFYLKQRVCTSAFTNYQCKNCECTKTHHNGCTPDFCPECCEIYGVCKYCGAVVEGINEE